MRRALAVAALLLAGCGSPAATGPTKITVFAAASLTEAFTTLGERFEAANPRIEVVFSFAGSSALARQINQGAPADVFASAAPANMEQVTGTGAVTAAPVTFARNTLQIAVPKGNPAGITGIGDFGRAGLKIALCAEQVPCGAAAAEVFEAAGVTAAPDTVEQDVKAVLAKVSLGEVDAALVYRTDVRSGKDVEGLDFAEAAQAVNDYPIAPLAKASDAATAQAFVDHVLSPEGREVLTAAGFAAP
ncbi:molybdate transport system substrate-binding protein [Lentzea xinjiangensis]|uniref:Molybdate transport system substrate-binding protein n=1 Tax=Lentzea xinjiangensis TaxID=402600 RepID=A0A1H9QPR0_9PSEU|nr:molybdate ABC transporter substrate-binding protein [Lentzea xinjiangensis]SER62438.1 molybdate transport system substrate-binding protein [Lentzea xinjiangensis]